MNNKQWLLIIAILFSTLATHAQIGTLNSQKILESMPIISKIDTLVQTAQQQYVQEYYKKKYQTQILLGVADSMYRSQNVGFAHADSIAKNAEMALIAYENEANKRLQDYKEVLLQPYLDQISVAIKKVAQFQKLKLVVDVLQLPILYADPTIDITDEVIKELGKK